MEPRDLRDRLRSAPPMGPQAAKVGETIDACLTDATKVLMNAQTRIANIRAVLFGPEPMNPAEQDAMPAGVLPALRYLIALARDIDAQLDAVQSRLG